MAIRSDGNADNRVQGVLRRLAGANEIVLEFASP